MISVGARYAREPALEGRRPLRHQHPAAVGGPPARRPHGAHPGRLARARYTMSKAAPQPARTAGSSGSGRRRREPERRRVDHDARHSSGRRGADRRAPRAHSANARARSGDRDDTATAAPRSRRPRPPPRGRRRRSRRSATAPPAARAARAPRVTPPRRCCHRRAVPVLPRTCCTRRPLGVAQRPVDGARRPSLWGTVTLPRRRPAPGPASAGRRRRARSGARRTPRRSPSARNAAFCMAGERECATGSPSRAKTRVLPSITAPCRRRGSTTCADQLLELDVGLAVARRGRTPNGSVTSASRRVAAGVRAEQVHLVLAAQLGHAGEMVARHGRA